MFAAAGALLISTILALILILFKFADAQKRYFWACFNVSKTVQCNLIYQEIPKPSKCLQAVFTKYKFYKIKLFIGYEETEDGCLKFETLLCANSSHKLGQFVHFSNLRVGTRGHAVYVLL